MLTMVVGVGQAEVALEFEKGRFDELNISQKIKTGLLTASPSASKPVSALAVILTAQSVPDYVPVELELINTA